MQQGEGHATVRWTEIEPITKM